ncbi:MAG TPA: hypothetical protein VJP85_06405 [Candidatus Baltobacteraceae bacterium]|nr:hypothetical protein [Candidatus Baltobacteraceae bacterium]
MNVLDLPVEVAESTLEMAIALSQTARGQRELLRAASFVHRCYVRALAPAPGERTHDLRWRRFVAALDAYLSRCAPSSQSDRLYAIVRENADLLEQETALAS